MSKKRIVFVSVGLLGILIAVLGTVGFVLTSKSSAQVDEALTNPPAAPAVQQPAVQEPAVQEPAVQKPAVQSEAEINAQYDALFSEAKSSSSSSDSYMDEGYGCHHDQAYDMSQED